MELPVPEDPRILQKLAERYLYPGVVFPVEPYSNRSGSIIHIVPERLGGVGPWAG